MVHTQGRAWVVRASRRYHQYYWFMFAHLPKCRWGQLAGMQLELEEVSKLQFVYLVKQSNKQASTGNMEAPLQHLCTQIG